MDKLVIDSDNNKGVFLLGGVSAILLGISYVLITVLYILGVALPSGNEEWLKHLARYTAEWWGILGLPVFTNFVFIFVAWSLYAFLKEINRSVTLARVFFIAVILVFRLNTNEY